MEERSPETTRRIQRERDRIENEDIINKYWTILIQEFFNYSLGVFDTTKPAFSNILDAAIEFVEACHKKVKRYTPLQIDDLLTEMHQKLTFRIETLPFAQQKLFLFGFKHFIDLTVQTFSAQKNDPELGEHFARLALWIPRVLHAAIDSFEEPNCLERYSETQRARLEIVKRVGSALAIFVDSRSLEKADTSTLIALSKTQAISYRGRALCSQYQSLRSGLFRIGRLTPDLASRLMAEERKHYAAILVDPHKAVTNYTFADEILEILNELLRNDTAEVLEQFLPKGKKVPDRTIPLCGLITREYFHQSESSADAEHEAVVTEVSHVPLVSQAMLEVDSQYKNLFSRFMQLLGDRNSLTTAALAEAFRNIAPSERLEILERLCDAIVENTDGIYDTTELHLSQRNADDDKRSIDNNFTKSQLKHIAILQSFYREVVKANPLELFEFRIEESQLLDYVIETGWSAKKPPTKNDTLISWRKAHARAIGQLNTQVSVKPQSSNNNNNNAK